MLILVNYDVLSGTYITNHHLVRHLFVPFKNINNSITTITILNPFPNSTVLLI